MQRPEYVVPSIYDSNRRGSSGSRMVSSRTFGSRRWADRQRRPADGSSSGPASGRAPKFCSSIPPPRLIIAPKLSTAPTGPTPEAVSASNVLWNRLNTEKRTSEPLLPTPTSKTPIQENFGFRGGYPEKCRRPELEKDEEWKFLYEKPLEGNEQQKNPEEKGPQVKEQVEAGSQHHRNLAAPAPSKQPAKVLGPIIDLTGDSDDEEPSAEDEEALARIERRVREESRRLERRRRRAAADATSHKPE
ncbi:hypothetical protein L3Y34_019440 [Caenorhabditis briggsae]|uniref:Uncharacterized protein n=1 Tax=Caenorhabditis briggsae TaxID=6238 RepID=A0AAE9DP04_CAEBR|nr:hypothetical protein L3Y34_019440 [Caenorhabditis briggsae]